MTRPAQDRQTGDTAVLCLVTWPERLPPHTHAHTHARTHTIVKTAGFLKPQPPRSPGGAAHTGALGSCRVPCHLSYDHPDVRSSAQPMHALLWNIPGRHPPRGEPWRAGGLGIRRVFVMLEEVERGHGTKDQGRKDRAPLASSRSAPKSWGWGGGTGLARAAGMLEACWPDCSPSGWSAVPGTNLGGRAPAPGT